ncbi:MAG: tRNA (adenosine(37)-N6)-threonylcarbamoyltransferase complex dimerization subunit type 1 TsaB [Alphaproteobacteria bacterium]
MAIECACGPTSVALWQNGHILDMLNDGQPNAQSAILMPMVEKLLKNTAIRYDELSAVACSVGPGSFTGIRVGLAAAGGICFAAKKPGLGISTLETTAYTAKDNGPYVHAILRAGKGEWYHQPFDMQNEPVAMADIAVGLPESVIASARRDTVWAGNVTHDDIDVIAAAPRADTLAMLAAEKSHHLRLTPLYIRPPDVSFPKKKL